MSEKANDKPSDYPKTMTRGEKERPVMDAAEEAEKAAEGWVTVETVDPYDTEPTFGAPGDDTHTKRRKKP